MNESAIKDSIYIDVSSIVYRFMQGRLSTGIDRVIMSYVSHYGEHALAIVCWSGRYWALPESFSKKLFLWLEKPHSPSKAKRIILLGIARGALQKRKPDGILFNIDYSGLDNQDYKRLINQLNLKAYFFVHDLIPITAPEFFNKKEELQHQTRMQEIAKNAKGIITVSQATKEQFYQFIQKEPDALPPVISSWLGSNLKEFKVNSRPINSPYFIIIGTIEPRKNHLLLLKLWCSLVTKYSSKSPKLVIIGQQGWGNLSIPEFLEQNPLIQDYVIVKSLCPDHELMNYLQHAQALLFPSFAEGYGIPLIEALTSDVPAIVSDIPVFREVGQDVPDYVSPFEDAQWEKMIEAYIESDSPQRVAQLQRLAHFKKPDWEQHFQQIREFISVHDKKTCHARADR